MPRTEKILCHVDSSDYPQNTLAYALSLPQHCGATLLLQDVVQPLTSTYSYDGFPNVFWNLESTADKLCEPCISAISP